LTPGQTGRKFIEPVRRRKVSAGSAGGAMVRGLLHGGVIAVTAVLGACASVRGFETPVPAPLAATAGPASAAFSAPPAPAELMSVTDGMREFLDRYVDPHAPRLRRLQDLANALLRPGLLGIQYDDLGTHSAEETFRLRSGNCMSLSLLFVALAREVGLDAHFEEVSIAPQWDRQRDLLLSFRHINVVGDVGRSTTYTMDFKPDLARARVDARHLSDAEAIAQFYNNRASEYLLDGRFAAAHAWYLRAIELAPRSSFVWSNLALLYGRTGQGAEGERLLRYALRLDPGNVSAINNLAALLESEGRTSEAGDLRVRAFKTQRRNPYYLLALAERADAQGRPGEALKLLGRAIRLDSGETLFYETAARIARALDDPDLARSYQASADALASAEMTSANPRLRL
jgi:tetratricopeptide (TPR) repeat protein